MPLQRRAFTATLLMATSIAGAYALTPRKRRADILGPFDLEASVPRQFGEWHVDTTVPRMVVDPQTQATIDKTYTKTLSRTYVNGKGQRIMLSIAYGAELSDSGMGLHYPEVCYPAQGFRVLSEQKLTLVLADRAVRAKRLETSLGDNRHEPVTYWTLIGDEAQYAGLDRKLSEIRSGLGGIRPDGLLFRVSNITRDTVAGFALNEAFADSIVRSMSPEARLRLAGLH